MSGTVRKFTVAQGDPGHTKLFALVDKVSERMSDMVCDDPCEAIATVQAMIVFCGNIIGRAHGFEVIDDDGLETLKAGMIFNLGQAIEGAKDVHCDCPDHGLQHSVH